jgi:hypothetical protein
MTSRTSRRRPVIPRRSPHDTPHAPALLIGFATDAALLEQLRAGVTPTRYQGPTSILGVIRHARQAAIPAILRPCHHYLGISQNPKVAQSLLRVVDSLFKLELDLSDIERAVQRFEQQISAIIATNPEAAAYLKELERRADAVAEGQTEEGMEPEALPSSEILIKDLEDFLKRRREQQ